MLGVVVVSSDCPPVKKIFRENAIRSFNSLEDTRSSMRIIQPAAWLWISMFVCIFTGLMIWVVAGTVEFSVDADGIILPEDNVKESESMLLANLNDHQEKIQTMQRLVNNKEKMLKKGFITINDYVQAKSDYESSKKEISDVSRESYLSHLRPVFSTSVSSNNHDLIALVFIDAKEAKNIISGMQAYLLPSGMSAYEYGYVKGTVLSISEYPVSKEMVFSYLGNQNLVDVFFKNGSPFMAKVRLSRAAQTPSGLAWTSKRGPAFNLQSGTMTSVKVVYQQYSPLRLVSMMGGV